jgi:hypothetical protein
MLAMQAAPYMGGSSTAVVTILVATALVIFWRVALKLIAAILAIGIVVLVLSWAEVVSRYLHHLPK